MVHHRIWWLTLDPSITERNGRKTLTTVQGIPSKFDHKKILKVVKKEFGTFHCPPPTDNLENDKLTRLPPSLQWHHHQ